MKDSFVDNFMSDDRKAALIVYDSLSRMQRYPKDPDEDLMKDLGLAPDEFDDEFLRIIKSLGIDDIHSPIFINLIPLRTVRDYVNLISKILKQN